MNELNNIITFIEAWSHLNNISDDTDLYPLLTTKFNEFIDLYSKEFEVDMKHYRRSFHIDAKESRDLGVLISRFFFWHYGKDERIPITPRLLSQFAVKGKWDFNYPPYKIHVI